MANLPIAPDRLALTLGKAAASQWQTPRWELADVLDYNAATCTAVLRTHSGKPLNDVPQLRPGNSDIEHLKIGTTVAIHYELGFPVICGVITLPGAAQTSIRPVSITGTTTTTEGNSVLPSRGANNYAPLNAPPDLTQGDYAKVGTHGNHVAVLEGGITSMGSPNAMVRSLGLTGQLQTIAKTTKTVTDFGNWSVNNDQGRTSFTLRAGTSQLTQTGRGEEHWTVRLDLGAADGDMMNFQITEPTGRTLFKLSAGADGRVQLYGDAGVDISSGSGGDNEMSSDILGSRSVTVGADDTLTIAGNRAVSVQKAYTESVTTDRSVTAGNNEFSSVNNDRTMTTGGKKVEIVSGGGAATATPGSNAYTTKILNGGWLVDIGNPADGANISAQAAFALKTSLGNITLDSGGAMSLKAKQINALEGLAVHVNGSDYSLLKTEDFLKDLGSFLNQLLIALQVGTAGSPVKQQLVGLNASIANLQQFVAKVMTGLPYQSLKAKNG